MEWVRRSTITNIAPVNFSNGFQVAPVAEARRQSYQSPQPLAVRSALLNWSIRAHRRRVGTVPGAGALDGGARSTVVTQISVHQRLPTGFDQHRRFEYHDGVWITVDFALFRCGHVVDAGHTMSVSCSLPLFAKYSGAQGRTVDFAISTHDIFAKLRDYFMKCIGASDIGPMTEFVRINHTGTPAL